MIVHAKAIAEWDTIRKKNREMQIKGNNRENESHIDHAYKVGDRVLQITRRFDRDGMLDNFKHKGPFKILRVFKNGTLDIEKNNYHETINCRRIMPYFESNVGNG
mmetsp:Transcript_3443/g.4798  ORF Transcript_3443/g.4798 Transcript_3443/m.4798 type:complete len:105 (+) Transcript_3443:356-670(+)